LRHYRRSADDTPTTLCYCAVGRDHYVCELGELRSPEAGVVDLVPPTSPFGDVIEGVGTDADADRLIAEARKRVAAIDKWIATWWYPGEEERKKEVNERELDTRDSRWSKSTAKTPTPTARSSGLRSVTTATVCTPTRYSRSVECGIAPDVTVPTSGSD
jgi:hypothetical protein